MQLSFFSSQIQYDRAQDCPKLVKPGPSGESANPKPKVLKKVRFIRTTPAGSTAAKVAPITAYRTPAKFNEVQSTSSGPVQTNPSGDSDMVQIPMNEYLKLQKELADLYRRVGKLEENL